MLLFLKNLSTENACGCDLALTTVLSGRQVETCIRTKHLFIPIFHKVVPIISTLVFLMNQKRSPLPPGQTAQGLRRDQ